MEKLHASITDLLNPVYLDAVVHAMKGHFFPYTNPDQISRICADVGVVMPTHDDFNRQFNERLGVLYMYACTQGASHKPILLAHQNAELVKKPYLQMVRLQLSVISYLSFAVDMLESCASDADSDQIKAHRANVTKQYRTACMLMTKIEEQEERRIANEPVQAK